MVGRLGVISAAVAFARSSKGKQAIAQARQRYDTPENRARLRQSVVDLRAGRKPGGSAGRV